MRGLSFLVDRTSLARRGSLLLLGSLAAISCSSEDRPSPAVLEGSEAALAPPSPPAIRGADQHASVIQASPRALERLQTIRRRFSAELGPGLAARFERSPGRAAIRPIFEDRDDGKEALATALVDLPAKASAVGAVSDKESGLEIRFKLEGASDVDAEIADGLALYRGGGPEGADVIQRAHRSGAEDFLVFEREPRASAVRYTALLGQGVSGLRLVANTLEFLDNTGVPRVRIAPPFAVDAAGERREARIAISGCAFDESPAAPWGRPITSPGAPFCSVSIALSTRGVRYPLLVDPQWVTTKDMVAPRTRHSATLLNPSASASPLLIAGGFDQAGAAQTSAELYEPLSRTFAATGSMTAARGAHTATLLSGSGAAPVLIAGGSTQGMGGSEIASMELYDAATGMFASDLSMPLGRFNHTATRIADGKVLIAGGNATQGQPTNTAYIYTFMPKSVAPTASLSASRAGHAAALLPSGSVLVTGGFVLGGAALQSGEIYAPATGMWAGVQKLGVASQNMTILRGFHTATPLASGAVLIAGGTNNSNGGIYTTSVDLYVDDGVKRGFVQTGSLAAGRANHTATELPTGEVLIAGGFNGSNVLAAPEMYQPPLGTFKALVAGGSLTARRDPTANLVNAGDWIAAGRGVVIIGGVGTAAMTLATAQVLIKPNGEACALAGECLSGFCTAGLCCDVQCNGACRSCLAAVKNDGSPDGACGNASPDTELGWKCFNNVEFLQKCDGNGNPIAGVAESCVPNKCDAQGERCSTACPCSDLGFCSDAGAPTGSGGGGAGGGAGAGGGPAGPHCEPRRDEGEHCEGGYQCFSDHCVDGVCCNQACEGQCQACDTKNNVGYCMALGSVASPEPPRRVACAGDGTACAGFCDGKFPNACSYPDTKTQCGEVTCGCPDEGCAVGPAEETQSTCDGIGACVASKMSCNGFRCEGTSACKASCATDADCLKKFTCIGGVCEALTGPKCDGDHTVKRPDGNDTDCTPIKCGGTGCLPACSSVDDCISPFVCNGDGKCVDQLKPPELPSCGCEAPGSAGGDAAPWALGAAALGFAIAAARRRSGA